MTFYRKYRPQTIAELDLKSVREQLVGALLAKAMPHAFLFAGPRGLGKTSAARILAKAINCENRQKGHSSKSSKVEATSSSVEPCNQCEACISITQGRALDVIEIDGASNRGIDDIRSLREKIRLSPVSLVKKIYVIDEVHMLTTEAFNALLKTLEEPPAHAIFILATTEPEKLPETIISRCFNLTFTRPTDEEVKGSLKRVIAGEKLQVDDDALVAIVRQADGSFRDAHKILEQLAFTGKRIDRKLFETIFQADKAGEFLNALEKKEVSRALSWLKKAKERGADPKSLVQKLLESLRDTLLSLYGVGEKSEPLFSETELKQLIDLLLGAGARLKASPLPWLPLELAVIEFCRISQGGGNSANQEPILKETAKPAVKIISTQGTTSAAKSNSDTASSLLSLEQALSQWEKVLQQVKPQNHSVEALLRSARPSGIKGRALVIEVFYEFHKGRLETPKCRAIVESSLQQVFGQPKLIVEYILGDKAQGAKNGADKEGDSELVQVAEEVFSK